MKTANSWIEERTYLVYFIPCVLATICYLNGLNGQFVHDDIFAIRNNPDVTGNNQIFQAFKNDFWGTRMVDFNSHKSYRPICILTFRLDYYLGGGNPAWFHVVNTALHVCVTLLLTHVFLQVLRTSRPCTLMSSCLFAVHPIHTEAVTGIVGRADVLAALFSLLSFYTYSRCVCDSKDTTKTASDREHGASTFTEKLSLQLPHLMASVTFAALGMLCKETGLMILGVSLVYELVCQRRMVVRENGNFTVSRKLSVFRCSTLILGGSVLLFLRFWIMDFQQPQVFEEEANPASFSPSLLTRLLTYIYLPVFNFWLLVCPIKLSYDWTGGSIPLLVTVQDYRNVQSLVFYAGAVILAGKVLRKVCSKDSNNDRECYESVVLLMSLSLMVLPFLPASNMFFRVGFVVAERVLYMPSAGYCLLVAHAILSTCRKRPVLKPIILTVFAAMLLMLIVRTLDRNQVWSSRRALFRSGVRGLPQNAKVHYNWANLLKDEGNFQAAEEHYRIAINLNPDVASYHLNLGTVLTNGTEAKLCYERALRICPKHTGALVNLGSALLNEGNDAGMTMIKQALAINPNHLEGLITMAYASIVSENFTEADKYSTQALSIGPDSSKAHLCRGVYFHNTGQASFALEAYLTSLQLNPRDSGALLNSAKIYFSAGQMKEAEMQLRKATGLDKGCSDCFSLLGSVYAKQGHTRNAIISLAHAYTLAPNNTNITLKYVQVLKDSHQRDKARSVLQELIHQTPHDQFVLKFAFRLSMEEKRFNDALQLIQDMIDAAEKMKDSSLGDLYRDQGEVYKNSGDHMNALKSYEKAILLNSANVDTFIDSGTIHFLQKNYSQAESYYLQALHLDPSNNLAKQNLEKLRIVYPESAKTKM